MKKSVKTVAMAAILATYFLGTTANAATVQTSEFGTMTYGLTRSGSTVTATTKTQKVAAKLITKVDVMLNSTGELIATADVTKKNATNNTVVKVTNYSSEVLAAFSTHEARGNSSVAKYCSTVF